jgi:hypothetical protein
MEQAHKLPSYRTYQGKVHSLAIWYNQGTLTEVEGSVQLTSSLSLFFVKKEKYSFSLKSSLF